MFIRYRVRCTDNAGHDHQLRVGDVVEAERGVWCVRCREEVPMQAERCPSCPGATLVDGYRVRGRDDRLDVWGWWCFEPADGQR